jgi:hypothetical protein
MKKLTFIVLSALLLFISCKKTEIILPDPPAFLEPKQEQWGLAINYTAKWCSPCGSWGAPLIHDLSEMGKVVAVTNHSSGDPMYNSTLYSQMSADRPTGGGIPAFWVGDSKTTSTSSMTQLLAKTPIAGIDMKTYREGNTMNIAYMVEFFSAGDGDYFLSLWMLESGIDGSASAGSYAQAGTSDPNYEHDFVIRQAYGNNVYGEKIFTSPAAGATYDKVVSMTVDAAWNQNVYIVACLWRFDAAGDPASYNPKYKYVNGFVVL